VFNNLGKSQLREIVRQLVTEVQSRLVERQITLDVDEGACDLVLEQAYDPEYGARPLRRYVENVIVTDLSKKILDGSLDDGSNVKVTRRRDEFDFVITKSKRPRITSDADSYDNARSASSM
jgi:ATP-dependent Clp protease ATP-binding subunit ClpB